MAFEKGKSGNPGGRRHGSLNKTTTVLKSAIDDAFKELGGKRWLVEQGKANPQAFMTLLGKLIPRDLSLEHRLSGSLEELVNQSIKQHPRGAQDETQNHGN